MSYARRDFYVKAVRTGLGDNQTIMPGTAGRDSGGIIAESPGGSASPSWIAVATMKHIATNFSAWTSSRLGPWRVPTGDLHLRRQVSRDFLCKNSGQSSLRFLFTVAAKNKKKCFRPLCSQRCSVMNRMKSIGPQAMSALTCPRSSRSPRRSEPGTPPHLRPWHMESWN